MLSDSSPVPVQVDGLEDVAAVAGGLWHSLAAKVAAVSVPAPVPGECDPGQQGVQLDAELIDGPDPTDPGTTATWTVALTVTACEDVTDVTAQGGTVAWATTTEQTNDGRIDNRRVNRRNRVLLWDVGANAARRPGGRHPDRGGHGR